MRRQILRFYGTAAGGATQGSITINMSAALANSAAGKYAADVAITTTHGLNGVSIQTLLADFSLNFLTQLQTGTTSAVPASVQLAHTLGLAPDALATIQADSALSALFGVTADSVAALQAAASLDTTLSMLVDAVQSGINYGSVDLSAALGLSSAAIAQAGAASSLAINAGLSSDAMATALASALLTQQLGLSTDGLRGVIHEAVSIAYGLGLQPTSAATANGAIALSVIPGTDFSAKLNTGGDVSLGVGFTINTHVPTTVQAAIALTSSLAFMVRGKATGWNDQGQVTSVWTEQGTIITSWTEQPKP